jgi:hypothetical protein
MLKNEQKFKNSTINKRNKIKMRMKLKKLKITKMKKSKNEQN